MSDAAMTSEEVRSRIVDLVRRDLIGPVPDDDNDLQEERLKGMEPPSGWYLTGYIAPGSEGAAAETTAGEAEEAETVTGDLLEESDDNASAADDDAEPEAPTSRRRFAPSSIGLTVLLPAGVDEVMVRVTWGDYLPEPPPSSFELTDDTAPTPDVEWQRSPQDVTLPLRVIADGKARTHNVPDSATPGVGGGSLQLVTHARPFTLNEPDRGERHVQALNVFLVNRRRAARRKYADIAYAFQARIEIIADQGIEPRFDLSSHDTDDQDRQLADLHYADIAEYAVGRSTSGAWAAPDLDGKIRRAWTDPLPQAEVERVAPNESIEDVEFGMEALAGLAERGGDALHSGLSDLPDQYQRWIEDQRALTRDLSGQRGTTGERLIDDMEDAKKRIAAGIDRLAKDDKACLAFRIMNLAIARAARRRIAAERKIDPADVRPPTWRPFQLAFILLNLSGLVEKTHEDRELVDLLFFPTGGGKTEAYLGLAAFTIAHRRLSAHGMLGAGLAVIMRYTLRLLTLDQLSRAAGMICALELMRTDDSFKDERGRPLLGDWPIEIGLWVGSDASPNVLGGRGKTGDHTAVTRVRKFKKDGKNAPAPIKTCPWCGTDFDQRSFDCVGRGQSGGWMSNFNAPKHMTITCANPACDFTRDRPLPLLTVDEAIYRRLPAFLIATVDKFASLPWVGESGAFFGHVNGHDDNGFYGAAKPGGRPLHNDQTLDPPELIIQDELHLISGPLGTVAGLYETAIDRLSTRWIGETRVRPKIVASTATVRRARDQITALFDRENTAVFPPPGIQRTDSWFAITQTPEEAPARLYLGLAAQGRGPKLVYLRALVSFMAAAAALYQEAGGAPSEGPGENNPADPYMTALCYFNALRELGSARRIVEDEVASRLKTYGDARRRIRPDHEQPFADREIGEPLELTSRVSTDDVAAAKKLLEKAFGKAGEQIVDVALATNMISVGLDITRLGLMLVQGQPKTAAEYIQATSRVGRDVKKPGLVVTVLNLHKPRDRGHYESFRQFHRSFYRAVEATSVTPWAARALDRSLAAVVVAIARHLRPELTPERAVRNLADHPDYRAQIIEEIVARAPEQAVVGGREALRNQLDQRLKDWVAVADNADRICYGGERIPGDQLLHAPLDPALDNLTPAHRRFVAARSMRDVEPSVLLRIRDPEGRPFQAEDVA